MLILYLRTLLFGACLGSEDLYYGPERNVATIESSLITATSGCDTTDCNVLINHSTNGDYIETGVSNQEDIKIKLNETYVISRVFLYPRSIADHQNAAKVKVLVNNEQCGNVMSDDLPDRTPILFQCNSVVGIRGDIIRIIRFGEQPSALSLYEIEVYAHPNELGIIMAEGDFGEKWMNNLLLGPYRRVLEKIRNVAARPIYQKWDREDIYLVYYAPSGSWQFKRNTTLGKSQSFAALRGRYRTWVPMDYNGDFCMAYKNFGEKGFRWDRCTKPVMFKPMIIHNFMTVSDGFEHSRTQRTILNGEYQLVEDQSKMFTKSGGRPVYRNMKWQVYFLHYVADERAWYFTEIHENKATDSFEHYPTAFVTLSEASLTPEGYEVIRCVLIEAYGGNRFCGGDVQFTGHGPAISHFDTVF